MSDYYVPAFTFPLIRSSKTNLEYTWIYTYGRLTYIVGEMLSLLLLFLLTYIACTLKLISFKQHRNWTWLFTDFWGIMKSESNLIKPCPGLWLDQPEYEQITNLKHEWVTPFTPGPDMSDWSQTSEIRVWRQLNNVYYLFFLPFQKISTFSRKRKASHQSVVDPCRIEIFRYGQNHTRGVDYFGLELEFNTDWAGGAEVDWFDLILVSRKSGSDVDVMSS